MAVYRLTTFDGVTLPKYDAAFDFSPAPARAGARLGLGGGYDVFRGERVRPELQVIEYTGTYTGAGSDLLLLDENGNMLADHASNLLVFEPIGADLRAQVEALTDKTGSWGELRRARLDDGVEHAKMGRLLQAGWSTRTQQRMVLAIISPRIEIADALWRSVTEKVVEQDLALALGLTGLEGHNSGGIECRNATVALTFAVRPQEFWLRGDDWEIGLSFEAGDAAAGTWTIDADKRAVTAPDGSDGYSRLRFGVEHSADGWMPLAQGRWSAAGREVVSADNPGGGVVAARLGYHEEFP